MRSGATEVPLKGFLETSFIDWRGHLSSVLFTGGCNFRCPFCHNRELVVRGAKVADIDLHHVLSRLRRFRQWVERVVVTGGEPTIHRGLPLLLTALRKEGMKIKLDTNGSAPDVLEGLLSAGLVDYIAMDLKGPLHSYPRWCGVPVDRSRIEKSVALLLQGKVDYEFRMTVVPFFHRERDVYDTVALVPQARRFVVQAFKPQNTLEPSFAHIRPFSPEKIKKIRENVAEILDPGRILPKTGEH